MITSDVECRLRSLLIQGLDGDQAAYREFLFKLGTLLHNYVRHQVLRLNRPDADVEDIVQEALIAIHNRRHTYDRVVPVTAWVHAIARYKLIDLLRTTERHKRHAALDTIVEDIGGEGPHMETALDVWRQIAILPDRLRVLMEMKLAGYSAAETAARTGMSEAAVKASVHRGLKVLRRIFRGGQ